ncbi:unnamed protein product, partial [Didymodactylos carnosus]
IRDLVARNPTVSTRAWFKLPTSYVAKLLNNIKMDSLRVSPDELATWELMDSELDTKAQNEDEENESSEDDSLLSVFESRPCFKRNRCE